MEIGTITQIKTVDEINEVDLERLRPKAGELNARSMELTDAWGTMFVLNPEIVERAALALGLNEAVSARLFDAVQSIADVRQRTEASRTTGPRKFTWHAFPGAVMVLRGIDDLAQSFHSVDDDYLAEFLEQHEEAFEAIVEAHPSYTNDLLFSPQVAERVLRVFGATVTAEGMLDLALTHGANCAEDVEGRIGCASSFIRGTALVLAARHSEI